MNELISVIINVYNGENFIRKCLDSVINQTYKNIEILVVNDGSTDNTLSILNNYKDKRIRIITTENKGLSLSRNVGIDNAKGEYLYFMDVDDFITCDAIEYLYNLIKKYNVQIATATPLDIYNYNYEVPKIKVKDELITKEDMLKKILLTKDRAGTTWNKIIKRELFLKNKFDDRIIDDVAHTYKLILSTDDIAYSNKITYFYFRHDESLLGRKIYNHVVDLYEAAVERYYYIKKIYPNMIENETCIILLAINYYTIDSKDIRKYMNSKYKFVRKLYSKNILKTDIRKNDKIKIRLFIICPKLCRLIVGIHIKINRLLKR